MSNFENFKRKRFTPDGGPGTDRDVFCVNQGSGINLSTFCEVFKNIRSLLRTLRKWVHNVLKFEIDSAVQKWMVYL